LALGRKKVEKKKRRVIKLRFGVGKNETVPESTKEEETRGKRGLPKKKGGVSSSPKTKRCASNWGFQPSRENLEWLFKKKRGSKFAETDHGPGRGKFWSGAGKKAAEPREKVLARTGDRTPLDLDAKKGGGNRGEQKRISRFWGNAI